MERPGWTSIGVLLTLLAAGAGLVWFLLQGDGERPAGARTESREHERGPAPGGAASSPLPGGLPPTKTRAFRPDEPHAPPPSAGTAPAVPDDLQREYETPDHAVSLVDDRVTALLLVLDPKLDPSTVGRECSDDGKHCVFEGPWLGDDFVNRWVQALSDGTTSVEAMQGVRFSKFHAEDRPHGRVFVLEAHAP